MTYEVHEVCRIFPIVDCKRGLEPNSLRGLTQQTGADTVERAGPGQGIRHDPGVSSHHLRRNSLHTPGQLGGRPSRERE